MKNELVIIKKQGVFCSSEVVADKFGKRHNYVIKKIQQLQTKFGTIKGLKSLTLNFHKTTNKYRNQEYLVYLMDKETFSLLCMQFTGDRALEWQAKFTHAFHAMERMLLLQNNLEWKQTRIQGKQIHRNLTDEIKNFVDYATQQGSENAKKYYITITKMEYKALRLIEKNEKVDDNFRNTLDIMDLNHLIAAEGVARKALIIGMEQQLHYKDIYQLAKNNVFQLADMMIIPQLTVGSTVI